MRKSGERDRKKDWKNGRKKERTPPIYHHPATTVLNSTIASESDWLCPSRNETIQLPRWIFVCIQDRQTDLNHSELWLFFKCFFWQWSIFTFLTPPVHKFCSMSNQMLLRLKCFHHHHQYGSGYVHMYVYYHSLIYNAYKSPQNRTRNRRIGANFRCPIQMSQKLTSSIENQFRPPA